MVKFQIGQVVFFRGKSFYAKLIHSYNFMEYGQKGFSHVGIITEVKKENIVIYEALADGFVKNDHNKLIVENRINLGGIFIKTPKNRMTHVLDNANKYLGRGYGWLDILSIGLAFLTRFKLSLSGADKLICSEAVARILYDSSNKKINISEEYSKPYDLVTPMDVFLSSYLE